MARARRQSGSGPAQRARWGEKYGQVVQAGGHEGMLWPYRLLQDGQGAPVERLGLSIAALSAIERRQVAQAGSQAGVLRAELFGFAQRGQKQLLSLGEVSPLVGSYCGRILFFPRRLLGASSYRPEDKAE